MDHGRNLRSRPVRGLMTPLTTKESRDNLCRKPLSKMKMEESFDDTEDSTSSSLEESTPNQQNKTKSPQSSNRYTSSPASQHEILSPEISNISKNLHSTSAVDKVKELRLEQSLTSDSSGDGTLNSTNHPTPNTSTRSRNPNVSTRSLDPNHSNGLHRTPRRRLNATETRSLYQETSMISDNDNNEGSKRFYLFVGIVTTIALAAIISSLYVDDLSQLGKLFDQMTTSPEPHPASKAKLMEELREMKHHTFRTQSEKTWRVIGSSLSSVLKRNLTMPACILLIGPKIDAQVTSNCLATRVSKAFYESVTGSSSGGGQIINSDQFTDINVNDAKRDLFSRLETSLNNDHVATLFNVHLLRGNVAMTLHAFCDEGSVVSNFPLSTLVMTLENNIQDENQYKTPDSLAEALLKAAWTSDLGEDKVASLISRVAVSVAEVIPEEDNPCN